MKIKLLTIIIDIILALGLILLIVWLIVADINPEGRRIIFHSGGDRNSLIDGPKPSAYSVIITLIIIWQRFSHFSLTWDNKLIKYLIKEAWPLALANVFVVIYFRIDTIMLSLMKSDQATGWYNAAYLLIFSLAFIAYVIMMSVYPKLSQLAKESIDKAKQLYRQTLYITGLAGILILGLSALIVKYLIPLLYGNEFLPTVSLAFLK